MNSPPHTGNKLRFSWRLLHVVRIARNVRCALPADLYHSSILLNMQWSNYIFECRSIRTAEAKSQSQELALLPPFSRHFSFSSIEPAVRQGRRLRALRCCSQSGFTAVYFHEYRRGFLTVAEPASSIARRKNHRGFAAGERSRGLSRGVE